MRWSSSLGSASSIAECSQSLRDCSSPARQRSSGTCSRARNSAKVTAIRMPTTMKSRSPSPAGGSPFPDGTLPQNTLVAGISTTRLVSGAAPLLLGFLPVALLASAQGGYFPAAWGWAAVGLLWPAGLYLVLRSSVRLSRAEVGLLSAWLALGAWIALSALWSRDLPQTFLEVERVLVYISGVWAIIVVAGREQARLVLGGVLAAITAVALFSLATRLFPGRLRVYDPTAVYRLAQPIGYWNALAIFTVIGMIVALGFAAHSRSVVIRAITAASLVPLVATFYFTFGRSAWIALAAGLVLMISLDPQRLQTIVTLLAVGPWCVIAVFLASRSSGLTHSGVTAAHAAHDGRRLALALLLLAGASAIANALVWFVSPRIVIPGWLRSAFAIALVLVVVAGLVATFARYGSPVSLAQKGYSAFKGPAPHAVNLNRRLLSFSGNGRYDLWRIAWDDAGRHPWLGSGTGTYGRFLLAHQPPDGAFVRDAHGLYIETLAELGPFGLALIVVALGIPLVVATRARRSPLVPAAAGAYAAFLVHTIVDWDWEVPAVML